MPAYNAEQTVARAIESALAQTEPRCEVLVIDDASSDATADIVARIAEQDRRVHLLHNPTNRGPAGARNAALLALAILANSRPELREKLRQFRTEQSEKVLSETLP